MILVGGYALVDLFVGAPAPDAPSELPARAVAGGSPFNVAVGLARLGAETAFLASIGTDTFGDFLLGRLRAEGVDTALVTRPALPTPVVVVGIGPNGAPTYTFHALNSADRALTAVTNPLPDRIEAIVLGSLVLAVEPIGSALLALAEREAGRRVISLDPNLRPAQVGELAAWRQRFARFAATASVIKASTEDIKAGWPGADAANLAARWLAGGTELVVITDGAAGAAAFHATGRVHVPGRAVAVQDTVGAGDSFHAALLTGLAEAGRLRCGAIAAMDPPALETVLRRAVLASSLTCTRRGADLPTQAELAACS